MHKEWLINDCLVEVTSMTFKDYKNKYNFESNEYEDSFEGYEVIFVIINSHVFMSKDYFDLIADKTYYGV